MADLLYGKACAVYSFIYRLPLVTVRSRPTNTGSDRDREEGKPTRREEALNE